MKEKKNAALFRQYERFAALLDPVPPPGRFRDLCRRAGADPRDLNRLIREELGLSGRRLLRRLRNGGTDPDARKYEVGRGKVL